MRIFAKTMGKIIGLLDDIHIKPRSMPKSTPKATVPIAPTPKTTGMGITVERTTATTAEEVKTALTTNPIKAEPKVQIPTSASTTSARPFLTQTAKNPYNLLKNPRQEVAVKTEEEFLAHINSRTFREHGIDFPRYTEADKAKLLELFKQDPQMVQYLESLQTSFIGRRLENRFSPEDIERLLKAMKTDENFVLELIHKTKPNGLPEFYAHEIKTIANNFAKNPEITKFLLSKQLKLEDITKLVNLNATNPQNYQKLVESGIFDLIEQGRVPKTIFANVRENLFFTKNFLNDVHKVHTGVPLVTEIPQGTPLENIGKFVENGEVGILNGKLYANQAGKAVELKLSKETFEELFPLIDRFKMEQGMLGDCWLISAMDNLMSNTEQRIDLYKLFSQEGRDILIRYPNGKNAIRFVNGEIYHDDGFISSNAKGLQMLEQSFVFHRAKAYTKGKESTDVVARLTEKPDLIYKLESGNEGEFTEAITGQDNLRSLKNWKDFFTVEIYRPIKFRLKTLGQDHSTHSTLKRWKDEKSTDLMIYNCRSLRATKGREHEVNYEFDLHSPHGYAVQDYDIADRMVTITNPHHTEVHIQAPLDILEDYGNFARFNRV